MAGKKQSQKNSSNKTQNKKKNTRSVPPKKNHFVSSETAADRAVEGMAAEQSGVPIKVVSAIICFALFILLSAIMLKPDGVVLVIFRNVLQGLLGKVGFYIAIPALLYAGFLLVKGRRYPVAMQLSCTAAFVILCGTLSHVIMNPVMPEYFLDKVTFLYQGGSSGSTGGIICGFLGIGTRWLFGSICSYFVLSIALVLTIMASFRVTILGIFRAVREFHQDEENEPKPVDNSAVLVDHIAQKRADHIRRKEESKSKSEEMLLFHQQEISDLPVQKEKTGKISRKKVDFMAEVNTDPSAPIGGEKPEHLKEITEKEEVPIIQPLETSEECDSISGQMPPLIVDPVFDEPASESISEVQKDEPMIQPQQKVTSQEAAASAQEVAQEIAEGAGSEKVEYCYPPLDLLGKPVRSATNGTEEMRENSRRLDETLESFKIEAHIVNVTRGPSVTRYEVELEKGVRLNKLTSCADDIALNLGASGVRIAAVPGKISVVGIEVPNRTVTTVTLREVIDSNEFNKAKSKSSFAVGKDISGSCIVGNIAKLPHMLIAGTTGSGKSVCMNSIIISLLYKAGPEDVKLIMVDPKMVELGIYNGIPHLLIPVVTDPKKAAGSLQWAVCEMLRRYKAMSDMGVRDLESYNSIVDSEGDGEHLPQVVVIIDELADLMLVAAKEVEESICRIAQMGRAAGIHLIIATQRPSADVITGIMKANIPSRIAFAVASAMESRIILDTQGAEKLVGKGDMLYAPIGCGKPHRVQGCFVTDSEVESVATYIKSHYTTDYDQQVMEEIEQKAAQTGNNSGSSDILPNGDEQDYDELLPNAVEILLDCGQASVSMLQRRLKLGYARAARIVDEMEDMGIVGPFQGSKPRTILITREQWAAMQGSPIPEQPQMTMDDLSEPEDEALQNQEDLE